MNTYRKPLTIVIHIVVWLAYMLLLIEVFSNRDTFEVAFRRVLFLILPQILLVYANVLLFIPGYFNRKRYLEYGAFVLGSFILIYIYYRYFPAMMNPYWLQEPAGMHGRLPLRGRGGMLEAFRMRAFFNMSSTVSIFLISSVIEIARLAIIKDKEAARLKSENLHTELKFLKSQVNPHFLFNALNNIYALSVMKSKEAPKMILRLSDILRYNLYDGVREKVPLEMEIRYIENYISLQKLKDEKITNIEFDAGNADGKMMISPLILISFVENSFKHSKIEDVDKSWVKIKLATEEEKIFFEISNSVPETAFSKDSSGGIGLENVNRRLELLYPDKHDLSIRQEKDQFIVTLTILSK